MVKRHPNAPSDEVIDIDIMAEELTRRLDVTYPSHVVGMWVFGSFASEHKEINKGDIDVFVGVQDYDPHGPITVSLSGTTIDVYTTRNHIYKNCLIDLQYGSPDEFLSKIPESERIRVPLNL